MVSVVAVGSFRSPVNYELSESALAGRPLVSIRGNSSDIRVPARYTFQTAPGGGCSSRMPTERRSASLQSLHQAEGKIRLLRVLGAPGIRDRGQHEEVAARVRSAKVCANPDPSRLPRPGASPG